MIIKRTGYHILRVSMAVTFLWIAILIVKAPLSWSGFLPPFFIDLLPIEPVMFMYFVAGFDALLGILFLIDAFVYWAGLLAALHMIGILAVSGVDDITVRDIAIMGAGFALFSETMPERWREWIHAKAKPAGGRI